MNYNPTRRALLLGSAMLAAAAAMPAFAQDKPVLRFSAVFSDKDIRADMTKMFAEEIKGDFTLEPYYGGTLFKQGTELVALQRGNLEVGNIAPQDISNQIPAWSVLTSAYLFRDAAHLRTFFNSELGAEFKKMAEDQLGVHILGPDLFRRPPGRAEAGQDDQHARGHGRHQAAHARRRCLAVPGDGARRQSDADGLCRGLYRAADRRHRRPGQSAAQRAEHEVLRSDVADRTDVAPRRLRSADRRGRGVECHEPRTSRPISRRPPTRPSTGAPSSIWPARRHWWRNSRRQGSRSTRPMSPPSVPMRNRSTSNPIWPRAGRKA